jgi:pilus assembly protein CpaB
MYRTLRHRFARFGRWPRLILAVGCVLLAVNSAVSARNAQAQRRGVPVLVAARDLATGRLLSAGDVRVAHWPAQLRPRGARAGPALAVGRRLAGSLTAGEPVTTARLLGRGLTTGLDPHSVAVPVTVTGPRVSELVRAGDRVDLVALPRTAADPLVASGDGGSGAAGPTTIVGSRLLVLSVLPGADPATTDLAVAADPVTALRLTRAAMSQVLAAVGVPP